jgi:hypothetical protein
MDLVDHGNIEGRLQPEDWAFAFTPSGAYTINGHSGQLEPSQFMTYKGDIYVTPEAMKLLVPVTLTIDERGQSFVLRATGPLALDMARQRDMARTKLSGRDQSGSLPLQAFPYEVIGRPFGDLRVSSQYSEGNSSRGGSSSGSFSYDALLSDELAYATAILFVSGSGDVSLQDARFQIGRDAPLGGAFGFVGLSSAWIGDVQAPVVPFVGSAGQGRGFEAGTFPLDQPDNFDLTTVDGDAPAGWDVELLRDKELLDFQRVNASGRYRFDKVPLLFGGNKLRVVMYGPDGQRREETHDFRVGGGMKQGGKVYWRVYAGQPSQRLLGSLLTVRSGDIYAASGDAQTAFSAEVELGLTQQFTASLFASRAPESFQINSPMRSTMGGGLHLSLPIIYMESNLARQEEGGRAWSTGANGAIGPVNISARHIKYNSWMSLESLQSAQALMSDTSLRISSSMPLGGHAFGISLTTEHWTYDNWNTETGSLLQTRFSIHGLSVGQGLDWHQYAYGAANMYGSSSERLYYVPSVSGEFRSVRVSSTARYDTKNNRLEQLQLLGAWRIDAKTNVNLGAIYGGEGPNGTASYGSSLGVSRDFGHFYGSAMLSRNALGAMTLSIGLNLSFGFDRRGKPALSSRPMAQSGSADVLVFNDKKGNGRFDPDVDEPLANASIRINGQRGSEQRTDDQGHLFLTGLNTMKPVTLQVDSGTVDDPFLANAKGGVRFVPRQGQTFDAQLAMVDTGEVSGNLTTLRAGQWVSMSGVVLELVTNLRLEDGARNGVGSGHSFFVKKDAAAVEQQTGMAAVRVLGAKRTQYDGGFLFDMVPPGDYLVRLRAGQHLQGGEIEAREIPVVITVDHLMVDGINLRVHIPVEERGNTGNTESDGSIEVRQ